MTTIANKDRATSLAHLLGEEIKRVEKQLQVHLLKNTPEESFIEEKVAYIQSLYSLQDRYLHSSES